jgi:2-polyprenyl-6-methoxyphenol hydroxylase-like FAD-dependent oxidoreductase
VASLLRSVLPLVRAVNRAGGLRAVCADASLLRVRPAWSRFLDAMCERRRERLRQRVLNGSQLRVVVVGGGPAGLLSALYAHRSGASVTVLERRSGYRRRLWFDIANGPWGASRSAMRQWGLDALLDELRLESFPNLSIDTASGIQCRVLERLLATVCLLQGVVVRFDARHASVNSAKRRVETSNGESFRFDVVIGADGTHSRVRSELGIAQFTVPDLHQTSLFVSFKSTPVSRAAQLADWRDQLRSLGVTHLFPRFYGRQSDMQILLSDRAAAAMTDPWTLMLRVCDFVFPKTFSSVAELRLSAGLNVVAAPLVFSRRVTTCVGACDSVGVIVGDAVFPAHYRLGIGVNNALDSMPDLAVFLSRLRGAAERSEWSALVSEKQKVDRARVETVFEYQASIMYLETMCDARVRLFYFSAPRRVLTDESYGVPEVPEAFFEVVAPGNVTMTVRDATALLPPRPDASRRTPPRFDDQ